MPSDLVLIEQQLATLYRYDDAGDMIAVNEYGSPAPPRLAIGRTREGTIWRCRADLPPTTRATLDRLLATEPPPRELREPPRTLPALRTALAAQAPVAGEYFGPAWYCPDPLLTPNDSATVALADGDALAATFPDLAPEVAVRQPCLAVRADGQIVAVCFSARFSLVAAEAGVETLAAYRGRGYAAATVAAWAAAVRQLGRLPLYSTSWDNTASQGVARKLGLVLYGADLSLT